MKGHAETRLYLTRLIWQTTFLHTLSCGIDGRSKTKNVHVQILHILYSWMIWHRNSYNGKKLAFCIVKHLHWTNPILKLKAHTENIFRYLNIILKPFSAWRIMTFVFYENLYASMILMLFTLLHRTVAFNGLPQDTLQFQVHSTECVLLKRMHKWVYNFLQKKILR